MIDFFIQIYIIRINCLLLLDPTKFLGVLTRSLVGITARNLQGKLKG